MNKMLFRGTATALITPFLPDGQVDYDGLRQNVRHQLDNGIQALVPLGTTGETPTLGEQEKTQIARVVVDTVHAAPRRVPVIVGVGTNSTQKTIEGAKQAEAWGADGLLIVTPYYNKPSQAGILAHFAAINAAVKTPIIVYNIKGRTGTNIETSTLARMAALDHIAGVKEASGDINQMMDVLSGIPSLPVYSGDDVMTLPLTVLGGQGVISVVSNLLPAQVVAMVNAAIAGNWVEARKRHYDLLAIFRGAFIETNPVPIKYAMNKRGLPAGSLRLPLVEMTPENQARMDAILARLG